MTEEDKSIKDIIDSGILMNKLTERILDTTMAKEFIKVVKYEEKEDE